MKIITKLKKLIATLTATSLMISFVVGPSLANSINNDSNINKYKQIFNDFILPYSYGKITDSHYAGTDRVIINIQDLHCHPQVQKNISNIIETFDKKYSVNKIYLEGAYGQVSTEWINRAFGNYKKLLEALDKMLETGRLTGAEYYSVKSGKTEIINGLEEKEPYLENIRRFGQIISNQEKIDLILQEIENSTKKLKNKYYSKRQQKLENLFNQYKSGQMSSQKYYSLLSKHIEKLGIDLTKYENTLIYVMLLDLQKDLDYSKVTKEFKELIANLKQQVPYTIYKSLVENTNNFKEVEKLYSYIIQLSREYDLNISLNFKELDKYFRYIELSRKINPIELVKEDELLTQEINTRFCQTKAEQDVLFITNFEKYLRDYVSSKMTSDNYDYYKKNIDTYRTLWNKYVDNKVLSLLDQYIEEADKFYKVNTDRNIYFTDNMFKNSDTLNKIEETTEAKTDVNKIIDNMKQVKEVDVVITGGFHSQTVTEILKNHGVSYIVITPNVTEGIKNAEETYYQIAKEQSKISFQAIANLIASLSPQSQQTLLNYIINPEEYNLSTSQNQIDAEKMTAEERAEKIAELYTARILESDDNKDLISLVKEIVDTEYKEKITPELLRKIKGTQLSKLLEDKQKLQSLIDLLEDNTYKQAINNVKEIIDYFINILKDVSKDIETEVESSETKSSASTLQKESTIEKLNKIGNTKLIKKLYKEDSGENFRQTVLGLAIGVIIETFSLWNPKFVEQHHFDSSIESGMKTVVWTIRALSIGLGMIPAVLCLVNPISAIFIVPTIILTEWIAHFFYNQDIVATTIKNKTQNLQNDDQLNIQDLFVSEIFSTDRFGKYLDDIDLYRDPYFAKNLLILQHNQQLYNEIVNNDRFAHKVFFLFYSLCDREIFEELNSDYDFFALRLFLDNNFENILIQKYKNDGKKIDELIVYKTALKITKSLYEKIGDNILDLKYYDIENIVETLLNEHFEKLDKINNTEYLSNDSGVFALNNKEIENGNKRVFSFNGIKKILELSKINPNYIENIEIDDDENPKAKIQQWLDDIRNYQKYKKEKKLSNGLFIYNGHGNSDIDFSEYAETEEIKKKIVLIVTGESEKEQIEASEKGHVTEISSEEIAQALLDSYKNGTNLEELTIDFSSCYSYLFAKNVMRYLTSLEQKEGLDLKYPQIITSAGENFEYGTNIPYENFTVDNKQYTLINYLQEKDVNLNQKITLGNWFDVPYYESLHTIFVSGTDIKEINLKYKNEILKKLHLSEDDISFTIRQQRYGLFVNQLKFVDKELALEIEFADVTNNKNELLQVLVYNVAKVKILEQDEKKKKREERILMKLVDIVLGESVVDSQSIPLEATELQKESTIEKLNKIGNTKLIKKLYKEKSGENFRQTVLGLAIGMIMETFSLWNPKFVEQHHFDSSIESGMKTVVWTIRALSIGLGMIPTIFCILNPISAIFIVPTIILTEWIIHFVYNLSVVSTQNKDKMLQIPQQYKGAARQLYNDGIRDNMLLKFLMKFREYKINYGKELSDLGYNNVDEFIEKVNNFYEITFVEGMFNVSYNEASNIYEEEMNLLATTDQFSYRKIKNLSTKEEQIKKLQEYINNERNESIKNWKQNLDKNYSPIEKMFIATGIIQYMRKAKTSTIPLKFDKRAIDKLLEKFKESTNVEQFNIYEQYQQIIIENITDDGNNPQVCKVEYKYEGTVVKGEWIRIKGKKSIEKDDKGNLERNKQILSAVSSENWCTNGRGGEISVLENNGSDFYAFIEEGQMKSSLGLVPADVLSNLKDKPWYYGLFEQGNGQNNIVPERYDEAVRQLQNIVKDETNKNYDEVASNTLTEIGYPNIIEKKRQKKEAQQEFLRKTRNMQDYTSQEARQLLEEAFSLVLTQDEDGNWNTVHEITSVMLEEMSDIDMSILEKFFRTIKNVEDGVEINKDDYVKYVKELNAGGTIIFRSVATIPEGIKLRTIKGNIILDGIVKVPENVIIDSGSSIDLHLVAFLSEGVTINAYKNIVLGNVETIPNKVTINAGGNLNLASVTSILDEAKIRTGGALTLGIKELRKGILDKVEYQSLILNEVKSVEEGLKIEANDGINLNSLTSIPEGVTINAGGTLSLGIKELTKEIAEKIKYKGLILNEVKSIEKGVTINASDSVILSSITDVPEGVTIKTAKTLTLGIKKLTKKIAERIQYHDFISGVVESIEEGITIKADGDVTLTSLTSIPEEVTISVGGNLNLMSVKTISENVTIDAGESIDLRTVTKIAEGVAINSGANIDLDSVTSLPEKVTINAHASMDLSALTTLPENKSNIELSFIFVHCKNSNIDEQLEDMNKRVKTDDDISRDMDFDSIIRDMMYEQLQTESTIEKLNKIGNTKLIKKLYKEKSGEIFRHTKLGIAIGTILETFSFWNPKFVEQHRFDLSIESGMRAVVWRIRALSIGIGLIPLIIGLVNPISAIFAVPAMIVTEWSTHYILNVQNIPEISELRNSIKPIDVDEEVAKTEVSKQFINLVEKYSIDKKFLSVYDAYLKGRKENIVRRELKTGEHIEQNSGYALGLTTFSLDNGNVLETVSGISDSDNGINLCTYSNGYPEFMSKKGLRLSGNDEYLETLLKDCIENNKVVYSFLPPNIYSFGVEDMKMAQEKYMANNPDLQQIVNVVFGGNYEPGVTKSEIDWIMKKMMLYEQDPEHNVNVMQYFHFVVGAYNFVDGDMDPTLFKKYFNAGDISKTFMNLLSNPISYMNDKIKVVSQDEITSSYDYVSNTIGRIFFIDTLIRDIFKAKDLSTVLESKKLLITTTSKQKKQLEQVLKANKVEDVAVVSIEIIKDPIYTIRSQMCLDVNKGIKARYDIREDKIVVYSKDGINVPKQEIQDLVIKAYFEERNKDVIEDVIAFAKTKDSTLNDITDRLNNAYTDSVTMPNKDTKFDISKRPISDITTVCKQEFLATGIKTFVVTLDQATKFANEIKELQEEKEFKFVVLCRDSKSIVDVNMYNGLMVNATDIYGLNQAKQLLESIKEKVAKQGLAKQISIKFSSEIYQQLNNANINIFDQYGIVPIVDANTENMNLKNIGKTEVENITEENFEQILRNNNVFSLIIDNATIFVNKRDLIKETNTKEQRYNKGYNASINSKLNYTCDDISKLERYLAIDVSDGKHSEQVLKNINLSQLGLSADSKSYLEYLANKFKYEEMLGFIRGVAMNSARKQIIDNLTEKGAIIDIEKFKKIADGKYQKSFLTLAVQLMLDGQNITTLLETGFIDSDMTTAQYLEMINEKVNVSMDEILKQNEYTITKLDNVTKAMDEFKNFVEMLDNLKIVKEQSVKFDISLDAVKGILKAA